MNSRWTQRRAWAGLVDVPDVAPTPCSVPWKMAMRA
jgi:hypothetical protein